jgi:hypothetical protein
VQVAGDLRHTEQCASRVASWEISAADAGQLDTVRRRLLRLPCVVDVQVTAGG